MYQHLSFLGTRLRDQRKSRRLTLRELAHSTGLSAGLISKIENFRTIPSLPVLLTIARELHLDPAKLFEGMTAPEDRQWLHVPAGSGSPVERESNHGMSYTLLLESGIAASEVQLMLVTVSPGAKRKAVSGAGMEIFYMLSGELEYRVGSDTVPLRPGDTLFFDGAIPHFPVNESKSDAVSLVIYLLSEEKSVVRYRK
jgi:transcriptional regulator with XRE-family HTH domain